MIDIPYEIKMNIIEFYEDMTGGPCFTVEGSVKLDAYRKWLKQFGIIRGKNYAHYTAKSEEDLTYIMLKFSK